MGSHKTAFSGLMVAFAFTGLSAQAAGITFNITYSQAVRNDSKFAQIQTAVNNVKSEFSSHYSDDITLNYTIDEGAIGLGQSLFSNNYWRGSYATLRGALAADAKSTDDATATALANLPATEPYAGGSEGWYAPSSQAKALGLITDQSVFDGAYTFDNTVSYTYNHTAAAGMYDFMGVTEHEFSELMGRTQQSNAFGYNIFDTMRFTSAGVRNVNLSGVSGVYFSFDNGSTSLAGFNSGGGDKQDLDGTDPTDPFNASVSTNRAVALNTTDFRTLDVIGYDTVSGVPEPSTFLLAIPMLGMGLFRLRSRQYRAATATEPVF
jgi:hypothetical protein